MNERINLAPRVHEDGSLTWGTEYVVSVQPPRVGWGDRTAVSCLAAPRELGEAYHYALNWANERGYSVAPVTFVHNVVVLKLERGGAS